MNEAYERDGFFSFAVYEPESGNELNMLLANEINYILPHELRYINAVPKLYYHVEGRQPIEVLYEKSKMGYDVLTALLLNVCDVMDKIKRYLLCLDDLVLDAAHIYHNWEAQKAEFIYLPGYQVPVTDQMCAIVEYMLKNVDFQDAAGADMIYRLYEDVQKRGASIEMFRAYCSGQMSGEQIIYSRKKAGIASEQINGEVGEKHHPDNTDTQLYGRQYGLRPLVGRLKDCVRNFSCMRKSGRSIPKAEDTISKAPVEENVMKVPEQELESATKLLGTAEETLYLSLVFFFFLLLIPKGRITIGRQPDSCDYVLHAQAVSRIHAALTLEKGNVIITDLNSRNGTYVNQERLELNQGVVLQRGDEVRFGSVIFVVVSSF